MRVRGELLFIPLAIFLSLLSGLIYLPSQTPYSPWNDGCDGLTLICERFDARIVLDFGGLNFNSTLILIPQRVLTGGETEFLRRFVEGGGVLIIGDAYGYSAPLLSRLGLEVTFHGSQILDQVYALDYRWILRCNATGFMDVELAVPNATHITFNVEPNFVAAWTSSYAYVDLDGNGFYDLEDLMGSFAVLAGWRIGGGAVILIPSQLFFLNGFVGRLGNLDFIGGLTVNRPLILYIGAVKLGVFDRFKFQLYSWTAERPLYLSFLGVFLASLILTFVWTSRYVDFGGFRVFHGFLLVCLSSTPFLLEFLFTLNPIYLAPCMVLPPLFPLSRSVFLSLSLALSFTSTLLNTSFIPVYLAVLLVVSRFLRFGFGYGFMGFSTISILILQAVNVLPVIINPYIVFTLSSSILFFIALSIISYVWFLRGVVVEPLSFPGEAYIGSTVSISFLVKCLRPVLCVISGFGGLVRRVVRGEGVVDFEFQIEHMGLNRIPSNIVVMDLNGFSSRSVGLFVAEVNSLPLTYKLLAKAKAILAEVGLGDLPRRISMAILVRVEELGAKLIPVQGEGLEALARGLGRIARGGVAEFVRRLVEEYLEVIGEVRVRFGEYVGVRDYEAGDSPREIHWKKSLSKLSLVSKEFSRGSWEEGGGRGGGGDAFLIVNLDSTNSLELDALTASLLHFVVERASRSAGALIDIFLVYGGYIVWLNGNAAGILDLFYRALKERPVEARFDYRSLNRYLSLEELEFMGRIANLSSFKTLSLALSMSGRLVVEALLMADVRPPRPFILIHGKALSTWASYLIYMLNNAGYTYVPFGGFGA